MKRKKAWHYVVGGIVLITFGSTMAQQPNIPSADLVVGQFLSIAGLILLVWGVVIKITQLVRKDEKVK